MFLFLIYNDSCRKHLCAWYKMNYLKDIIKFSKRLFRYSDVTEKKRIYRTYKTHFAVIEIGNADIYKYFPISNKYNAHETHSPINR